MTSTTYHQLFITEIRRRLIVECQERAIKCLDLLTEEEIWYRPNDQSNSVGNLVLHLCGNVRQWLFSTVGGQSDTRTRQKEFEAPAGMMTRDELKSMIRRLMLEAEKILDSVTEEQLRQSYRVQGYLENGVAILVHITEHFSYHVGQISYFVKAHKDLDLGYYAGEDLDRKD